LGYLLGNLSLKGIEPKRPQSKGITDLGRLGQELELLEKPTNRGSFKRVLGAKSPAKRHKVLIRDTQQESPRKHPQNSAKKIKRKSSENHLTGKRERQHKALRNQTESSIHTMKVHTWSSLPPNHPSLFLDLT
jgi:hypothetical protein